MSFKLSVYFNSIKVQLELGGVCSSVGVSPFQFHKGTIRTDQAKEDGRPHENFNSIKVQLELRVLSLHTTTKCHFNSIKVQLEQKMLIITNSNSINFNSIKVQLELVF